MREQLYFHFVNDAGISAIVDERVFPQRVPTGNALPFLEFTFVERESAYDQDGYNKYNQVRIDINSNGPTLGQAVTLSEAVFDSLDIQNILIGEVGNQEELCGTRLDTEIDNFFLFDGSEDGVRTITQTYIISYLEA